MEVEFFHEREDAMFRRLFAVIIGLSLIGGITVAQASELILRVDTDGFADFDTSAGPAPDGPGGAFYVSGDICAELDLLGDCTPIGKFRCWGWLIGNDEGPSVVSQEFDLFDRGKIQVQGLEDEGPRAVVGGTGDFRNVRGEATGFDFSQFALPTFNGEFIVTFKLHGARGNGSDDD